MLQLRAFKNELGTILINQDSKIVSYYPINLKQPHRNLKTITHNGWVYDLKWLNPTCKYRKHWLNQIMIAKSKNLHKTFFNSSAPITEDLINRWQKESKGLPIKINRVNHYQFSIKTI